MEYPCLNGSWARATVSASLLLVAVASCIIFSSQKYLFWDSPLPNRTNEDGGSLQQQLAAARRDSNASFDKQDRPFRAVEFQSPHQLVNDSTDITRGKNSFCQRGAPCHFLLDSDGGISAAQLLALEMEDNSIGELEDLSIRSNGTNDDTSPWESSTLGGIQHISFFPCPAGMQDFISCQESFSGKNHRCDVELEAQHCVIPAPASYMRPFKWPQCQRQVRALNVPAVPLLKRTDAQNWARISGSLILFSQQEPIFSSTADAYVENLEKLAPSLKFGKKTRVVLDGTGGSGCLSVALEKKGVLTMTIAAKESLNNGIQLILERGQPGLVQTIARHRLPYPSQAFDLFHFAASEASWIDSDGLLLLEADRLVRAGGFFIFKKNAREDTYISEMIRLATNMCWELVAQDDSFITWQKPVNKECYSVQLQLHSRSCSSPFPPNAAWNAPLIHCLVGLVEKVEAVVESWPGRLTLPPRRLHHVPTAGIKKAKHEVYTADLNYWKEVTSFYLRSFGQSRILDIRNVLDMNSGYGGFAAAIALREPALPWWVLNVIPISSPDRLPVIFDRGLLGVYHDWCKALDIYPRTFDIVHASWLFSNEFRCNISNIALEMDRLLRPGGFALLRDKKDLIFQFKAVAETLKWKATVIDTESGPKGIDKLLHCQKTLWKLKSSKKS